MRRSRRRATYLQRLLWALQHPLVERQMIALQTLAAIGDPAAWPAVHRLLESADPYLAAAALRTLAAIDPRAARPLIRHLRDHSNTILRATADQLSVAIGTGGC